MSIFSILKIIGTFVLILKSRVCFQCNSYDLPFRLLWMVFGKYVQKLEEQFNSQALTVVKYLFLS